MTALEIGMLNLVSKLTCESPFFSVLDGSVIYLGTKFVQMVNSDDYDFSIEEATELLRTIKETLPLGFVKHTETNFSYKYIEEEIPNVKDMLYEKEINEIVLLPGQLLTETSRGIKFNHIKHNVDPDYQRIYMQFMVLLGEYRTATFKPTDGSEVVRVEFHRSLINELPKIISSIDFDKKGTVEPFSQFRSDTYAKHYAEVYEQIWMKEKDPYKSNSGNPIFPVPTRTERHRKQIGGF